MSELIEYQNQRIEALTKRVVELEAQVLRMNLETPKKAREYNVVFDKPINESVIKN